MSPEQSQQLQQEFSAILSDMLSDMQDIILELQSNGVALPVSKLDIGSSISVLTYVLSAYNANLKKPILPSKELTLTKALVALVKAWTKVDTTKIYK